MDRISRAFHTPVLERIPLHHSQYAYRAGKSTEIALVQLIDVIQDAPTNKGTVVRAFFGIEGAFANTPHESFKRALAYRGVDSTTCRWMAQLQSTSTVETHIKQDTICIFTTRGCPQGGVLLQLMWSLTIDELLCTLTDLGIPCQGYADNIVIFARGKFGTILTNIVQRGPELTKRYIGEVSISPKKITLVVFSRKQKFNLKTVRIDTEWKNEVKYLELTLDNNFF